jgi:hypothetical protein
MNEALPQLLRAIADGSLAVSNRHDVIFNAAADEIERLRRVNKEIVAVGDSLIAENDQMRAALAFYANLQNYTAEQGGFPSPPVLTDTGDRARAAIATPGAR